MICVKEVKTRKQRKEFVEFPLNLYKSNPYYVPALYSDEMKLFTNKNVYCDQAISLFLNAYKDGIMVGRIQGILQKASNEKWGQKRIRFTRYDVIDDIEVSKALFSEIEKWAISLKMEEVVGPLGYSDLEREGLLIEGFDELSTFEESYNYPYYKTHLDTLGYVKDVDWVERKLYAPKKIDPRIKRVSDLMLKRYDLHFGQAKNTRDFLKKYGDEFFEILDKTYANIYGTVPFTARMKKSLISSFKLIIDIKYVAVILDKNNKVVCFGLCFPSIAKAVQKSGGRLTLPAIIRLLKAIKKPKVIDLALIGVLPEYQSKGIATAFISEIMRMLSTGITYAETNLNLEDNISIQNQWKVFDNILHKRRRCFIKKIDNAL